MQRAAQALAIMFLISVAVTIVLGMTNVGAILRVHGLGQPAPRPADVDGHRERAMARPDA